MRAPTIAADQAEMCNCESAYCGHHGGNLANGRTLRPHEHYHCQPCPNRAGRVRMAYVGPICDECAAVARTLNSSLLKEGLMKASTSHDDRVRKAHALQDARGRAGPPNPSTPSFLGLQRCQQKA